MTSHFLWTPSPKEIAQRGPRLLDLFRKRWPDAFATYLPLKIGIRQDLARAGAAQMDVIIFLQWYVEQPEYLATQAEPGAQRIDLNGQLVGPVSDENANYAVQRLEDLRYAEFRRALLDGAGA